MKNSYNLLISNKIWANLGRVIGMIGLLIGLGLVAGCAKKPVAKANANPSLKEQRAQFLGQMEKQGIRVIREGQILRVIVPSDELFIVHSANFNKKYAPTLKTVTSYMNTFNKINVTVSAYGDAYHPVGMPKKRKEALTTRQAQEVANILSSLGLDARLTTSVGGGDKNAIAWNGTSDGSALNRRVEITFQFYPTYKNYN